MSHRDFNAATLTGANPLLMFPNGCSFNATDVFVGSGRIHKITISQTVFPAAAPPQKSLAISVFDCLDAITGRIAQGGTTTQESYRLIAGTQTIGAYGEPFAESAAAIPANILALKKPVNHIFHLTPTDPSFTLDIDHDCVAGMVVVLSDPLGGPPVGIYAVSITYTPWVSGGTRRRRAYRPGSTTKVEPPVRTNFAL